MTAPSTKGALLRSTRPPPLESCSIAIWVLSTALPRSTRIRTPSGPRTSSIAARRLDRREQAAADLHREVVLLDLDPKRAGDAAAPFIDFFQDYPGNQPQQPHRRIADPVGFQMAGRVVEQPHGNRFKLQVELAGLMEHPEVLHDVV